MVIKQTTLDLNGPFIAFSVQPTDATATAGIATFVGIATAYFEDSDPENIFDTNTGEIAYQWYAVGYGALSDGQFQNTNTTFTGTGTSTLTVNNLDYSTSGLQFYVNADYIPSAYSQPSGSAVTVGTARSTGEAINDTLDSNIANLIVPPNIVITKQPESLVDSSAVCISVISTARDAREIQTSWNSFRESYPFRPFFLLQVNDNSDLFEPESFELDQLAIGPIDVNKDSGEPKLRSDWFDICNLSQYPEGTSISLSIDNSGDLTENAVSASLALFESQCASAGLVIYKESMPDKNWVIEHNRELPEESGLSIPAGSSGTFTVEAELEDGTTEGLLYQWYFENGKQITDGIEVNGVSFKGSKAPTLRASAVGENLSVDQPAVCISVIESVRNVENRPTIEGDWKQFRLNYPNRPFYLLQPAVYWDLFPPTQFLTDTLAIGPIRVNVDNSDPNLVSDWFSICNLSQYPRGTSISLALDNTGNFNSASISASFDLFKAKCDAAGLVIYGANLADSFTVNNPLDREFTMTPERWAVDHNRELPEVSYQTSNKVYVEVSNLTSFNSPVTSDIASFDIRESRNIIRFEEYDGTSTAKLYYNILNYEGYTYTLSHDKYLCFYGGEKDTEVELEIYGSKGSEYAGGRFAGQGGKSIIRFIAKKNEEYIIAPLQEVGVGAVFIYRKSRLMVAVGSGGNSGRATGRGGDGGGVNVGGKDGQPIRDAGRGGQLIAEGTLPSSSGIFGSVFATTTNLTSFLTFGDELASQAEGGRALSCPRGIYWSSQEKQPCEDLGNIQYYNANGTLVTNSATIDRGFKAGFGIRETAGATLYQSSGSVFDEYSKGGYGATGGWGGRAGRNGGGGSGYSDGSVEIVSTEQGGSNGPAKVIFRSPQKRSRPELPTTLASIGSVYHIFNDNTNADVSLTWGGAVANVLSEGKDAADFLPGITFNALNPSTGYQIYKHYLITMIDEFSSLEILDISFTNVDGQTLPVDVDFISKVDAFRWRVWFALQQGNTYNTFVSSFTVKGNK